MSFGKMVTQPILLLLVLGIVATSWALRTRPDRRLTHFLRIALAAQTALLVLSIPAVSWLLEQFVSVRQRSLVAPSLIVVAGGGYGYTGWDGAKPLSAATTARVLSGVSWWETNRDAVLVMAGEAGGAGSSPTIPMAVQMKELAVSRGVPASQILVETVSRNTREHPVALRDVVGITTDRTVGIVTSPWHLRRTRREFERYYDDVVLMPNRRRVPPIGSLEMWAPQVVGLQESTDVVHEIIGIVWSELIYRVAGEPELESSGRTAG